MGNKEVQANNVNHWSELNHIADEYDETSSGTQILEKIKAIQNAISQKDKTIMKNLNKKPRVQTIFLCILNNKIFIK